MTFIMSAAPRRQIYAAVELNTAHRIEIKLHFHYRTDLNYSSLTKVASSKKKYKCSKKSCFV